MKTSTQFGKEPEKISQGLSYHTEIPEETIIRYKTITKDNKSIDSLTIQELQRSTDICTMNNSLSPVYAHGYSSVPCSTPQPVSIVLGGTGSSSRDVEPYGPLSCSLGTQCPQTKLGTSRPRMFPSLLKLTLLSMISIFCSINIFFSFLYVT